MFEFNFYGQTAQLDWYVQDLITSSLSSVYGQELLTRGFIKGSNLPIPTHNLFDFLGKNKEIMLAMTSQQLADLFINKNLYHKINNSIWINISGKIISDGLFLRLWNEILIHINAEDKQKLVLEICEDSINDSLVVGKISYLQKLGFKIAMDDFGAGHSNLIRLSQVNFDFIKLDLQLIKNTPEDLWATSLYREVIELCSSKGALIVAEGIETKAQSDFVRWAGVDIIQGFFYSEPYPLT